MISAVAASSTATNRHWGKERPGDPLGHEASDIKENHEGQRQR